MKIIVDFIILIKIKVIFTLFHNNMTSINVKRQQKDNSQKSESQFKLSNPQMIRGGLIGIAISALVSYNSGRYNRLGAAFRRFRFIKNFIQVNKKPLMPLLTNYYTPNLSVVVNNFICYSGEPGIGKSYHFQNMAYSQSGVRPCLYLAFKSSGKDVSFLEDLAQQVEYGDQNPGILSQILKAVKKIDEINKHPYRLWIKIMMTHIFYGLATYGIMFSSMSATYGIPLFGFLGTSYLYYIQFMIPFIVQSFRRTIPLIIFDDLNKIEHLGMLSQIVRYLQLLQNNMANVILISSDEETWSKLRRQPGVKDRLRLRQVNYNHIYSASKLLQMLGDQKGYDVFMSYVSGNALYNKQIVISLAKELIGRRQVTLRRFISILKLNDEQEYEKLVEVLSQEKISNGQIVQKFTDILYESEMQTMVSNLKNIKREISMSSEQFFIQLKLLLKKGKLQSDNILGPHLKAYNIVRDLRSQYVFNGKFMYTIFNMSVKEYEKDMKEFYEQEYHKQSFVEKTARQQSKQKSEQTGEQKQSIVQKN